MDGGWVGFVFGCVDLKRGGGWVFFCLGDCLLFVGCVWDGWIEDGSCGCEAGLVAPVQTAWIRHLPYLRYGDDGIGTRFCTRRDGIYFAVYT